MMRIVFFIGIFVLAVVAVQFGMPKLWLMVLAFTMVIGGTLYDFVFWPESNTPMYRRRGRTWVALGCFGLAIPLIMLVQPIDYAMITILVLMMVGQVRRLWAIRNWQWDAS